jgi:L-amino acid N-acyltransferase YncA
MVTFSPATEKDLGTIKEICDYYILNTTGTFHSDTGHDP